MHELARQCCLLMLRTYFTLTLHSFITGAHAAQKPCRPESLDLLAHYLSSRHTAQHKQCACAPSPQGAVHCLPKRCARPDSHDSPGPAQVVAGLRRAPAPGGQTRLPASAESSALLQTCVMPCAAACPDGRTGHRQGPASAPASGRQGRPARASGPPRSRRCTRPARRAPRPARRARRAASPARRRPRRRRHGRAAATRARAARPAPAPPCATAASSAGCAGRAVWRSPAAARAGEPGQAPAAWPPSAPG